MGQKKLKCKNCNNILSVKHLKVFHCDKNKIVLLIKCKNDRCKKNNFIDCSDWTIK